MKLTRSGQLDKLPPKTAYSNCVVMIESRDLAFGLDKFGARKTRGITFCQYPFFNMSHGLYGHNEVERQMPEWKRLLKTGSEREYFRFVTEYLQSHLRMSDETLLWYNAAP